jgi:DNA-binding MarR family transcriptional regulator
VVGEEESRIFLFVIASSYKMPDTLHALVQGSSGSGKTHLIIKLSAMMPEEDCITLTRVTDSSFYNYGEYDLKNKLLVMEDLDGLKEDAFLAFRELQSRGMLTSSTSVKDEQGNIKGMIRTVRGPIGSMSATTRGTLYEDNMSRSFLIAVDESKTQTQRVIDYQNKKAAGLINREEEKKVTLFIQNCIRLLKPLEVVNPYAGRLSLPEEAHKIRRLNELYQAFVKQVTLINQYQRKKDAQGRLVTEKEDLQIACNIMFESILLKVDELDGSLRTFYEQLKEYLKRQYQHSESAEFTQREIRQQFHISKAQVHRHLYSLMSLEYIRQSGGYSNRGFKFRVVYWDDYKSLRNKVRRYLEEQISRLDETPGDASETPEPL